MIDDDNDPEFDPDTPCDFDDKVAARTEGFVKLLVVVDGMKDKELRREGVLMLKAIRLSFRIKKTGELTAIQGGKDDSSDAL